MMRWKHTKAIGIVLVAALPLALAGCGSSSDDTAEVPPPPPVVEPDPVAVEMKGIDDAIAAAQTAVAAVNDASTDEMVMAADAAVAAAMKAIADATRITAGDVAAANARLATITGQFASAKTSRDMSMDLASQSQAIEDAIAAAMTAVGAVMDDSDAATVTAADDAIAAANAAIAAAGDISNAEAAAANNRVAALMSTLATAKSSRMAAMDDAENIRTQIAAITEAAGNVDTSDLTDQAKIDAAEAAIALLKAAIAAAVDVDDTSMYQSQVDAAEAEVMTAQGALDTQGRMMVQRTAISDAVPAARTAVGAVNDDATDEDVTAADGAIAALRAAIAAAADLPEGDATVASGQATLDTLVIQLASAKTSRMMAMDEAAAEQRMAAIDAAKDVLAEKEGALNALADDATHEETRDAQRMVEAAANALHDVLQMNGGSAADIEAAIRTAQTAKVAADALQATITAAAAAEEQRKMQAISDAQTPLTEAEEALAELGEDATEKEKRDAHRAVERAADNLIQALADNDGTADQIEAAEMKRDSAKMMADELTSPIEIAEQRRAITDALADLAAKVAAVDDEATNDEVTAANEALTAARKAIADGTALPEEERTAYVPAVDAHANALVTAEKSRETALAAKDTEDRNTARLESNAASMLVAEAIMKHEASGDGDDATDGHQIKLPASLMAGSLDTAHKDGVTTIELRRSTGQKMAGETAQAPDGWTGRKFSFDKNQGAVFTNRGPATEKVDSYTWYIFFADGGAGANDRSLAPNATTGAISLVDTGLNSEFFSVAGFPSAPDKEATNEIATLPAAWSAKGSYRGVPGEFECAAECVLTRVIDATAGTDTVTMSSAMTFTPTLGTNQEPADIEIEVTTTTPDTSYALFGYWMTETMTAGKASRLIETFADATSHGDLASDVTTLTGKATYSGAAAGLYVHKAGAEDSLVVSDGEFIANAALTAQFGAAADDAGKTAVADLWAVSGTVSDFQSTTGDHDLSAWTLMLSKKDLGTRDGGTVATGSLATFADGVTSGGTGTEAGAWSATFFGNAGSGTADTAVDDHPAAASGEFNGHFSNGHVAGAFGVEKD